jgi:Right handed beta helix region
MPVLVPSARRPAERPIARVRRCRRSGVRRALVLTVVALLATACRAVPFQHGSTDGVGNDIPDVDRTMSPGAEIDATGSTDVTAALQRFLDGVPDHTRISFAPGAEYRLDGSLTLENRNDLVIDGNGATFFAIEKGDRTRTQWNLYLLSNVIFEDMRIRGANPNGGLDDDAYDPTREAQHGVNVRGGERIQLRNLEITDVYGDFIYVSSIPSPYLAQPDSIWIHDNRVARSGRQGIALTAGTRAVIERNDITDVRRSTIDLEPGTNGSVRDVYIRHNRVGPGRLLFIAGHGGGDVSDIYVTDNVLHGKSLGIDMRAPDGVRRTNVVVSRNTSDHPVGNGRMTIMRFVGYDHVVVKDNREPGQEGRDMRMVGLHNTCHATVTGNSTGQHGSPEQFLVLEPAENCAARASTRPFVPPSWSTATSTSIEVGGRETLAAHGCPDIAHCDGMVSGNAVPIATNVENSTDPTMSTMLDGPQRWDIPLRPGNYEVTLAFVAPHSDAPIFHLDTDRGRVLLAFDTKVEAGGPNRVVESTFRTATGDGALTLSFVGHPTLSYIRVVRA